MSWFAGVERGVPAVGLGGTEGFLLITPCWLAGWARTALARRVVWMWGWQIGGCALWGWGQVLRPGAVMMA